MQIQADALMSFFFGEMIDCIDKRPGCTEYIFVLGVVDLVPAHANTPMRFDISIGTGTILWHFVEQRYGSSLGRGFFNFIV